jgi:hypothetical protein
VNSDSVRDPNQHFRILGVCWIVYGIICLLAGLWLISFTNTATVMFGALLNRVPNPFALMSDFHLIYSISIALSFICGVIDIVAGLALTAGLSSGRALGLIAGFLSLSSIPLGTTLGIYSLIVLLPINSARTSSAVAEHRAANLKQQPATM